MHTDDQGNAMCFLKMVPSFIEQATVTSQRLTMVGREDNDGVFKQAGLEEVLVEPPNLTVYHAGPGIVIPDGRCPILPA